MTTRQQQRARQHANRHRKPVSAEQTPVIQQGQTGLRRFASACEAYNLDIETALRGRREAIDEAWADYQHKAAAAEAEYERAAAAAGAAYEQRTAASHQPEPDGEPDDTEQSGEA